MKAKTTLGLLAMFACWSMGFSQAGLIAHYPLDGNAHDVGGNSLDGILMGNPTPTTDRGGNPNSAYYFDGVDDHIDLGPSLLLKPTTAVTLSLWAHSQNWGGFSSWAALAGNTQSGGYELIVNGGSVVLEAEVRRNGTYGVADQLLTTIGSGWHHFALTFDGRYTLLYIDGVAVDTDDAGANYAIGYDYPGNYTLIGAEAGYLETEGDYFTGKLDDVRFFDRALSGTEILDLFNTPVGVANPTIDDVHWQVFPNPATDALHLEASASHKQPGQIMLVDASGKLVQEPLEVTIVPGTQSWSLDLKSLPTGLYFCRLVTGSMHFEEKIVHFR